VAILKAEFGSNAIPVYRGGAANAQHVGPLLSSVNLQSSIMATQSSIANLQPRLQAIFGLLSVADDTQIRSIFRQTDEHLLELAQHFGSHRAGWEGTGLELVWLPSGQIEVSSFVGTGLDGSHRVDFIVSLTPTWASSDFPTEAAWEIEAQIQADCQHTTNHRSMHLVHELPTRRRSYPIDSALALRDMAAELLILGRDTPIEYWLQLAGDEQNERER